MMWPFGRRTRNGYADFGPIQIPPVPQVIQLTDRTTGLKWFLSWGANDRIALSDEISAGVLAREGLRAYDAYNEPPFGSDGQMRIFVDTGRLGIDFATFDIATQDLDVAPIYARTNSAYRVVDFDIDDISRIHLGLET